MHVNLNGFFRTSEHNHFTHLHIPMSADRTVIHRSILKILAVWLVITWTVQLPCDIYLYTFKTKAHVQSTPDTLTEELVATSSNT